MSAHRCLGARPSLLAAALAAALLAVNVVALAAGADGWQPHRKLSAGAGEASLAINFARAIAADDAGNVHVVWFQQTARVSHVLYRRSTDGGRSWQRAVRLSPAGSWAERPAIAAAGARLFVVWHVRDGRGHDVFLRRSGDGGSSWAAARALTASHAAAHAAVAATGDAVHVSWGDTRSGVAEMYTRASGDQGMTWSAERRLSPPGYASWVPTIEADGERVVAAWVDTRDGNEEEYLRRSTDGGASWEPLLRLTRDDRNSWAPSVAVAGEAVHVAWFDQRDAPWSPFDAETMLDEAMRLLGLEVAVPPAGVLVPHPLEAARRRTAEKARLVEAAAPGWIARGGDAARLQAILAELQALGERGASYLEKERKIDEAMRLLQLGYEAGPVDDLPQVYYGEALRIRMEDKLLQVRSAAPGWAAAGGDPAHLERLLAEMGRRLQLATSEWEIYYRRSRDGGATFEPGRRLTFAPGLSQRPSLAAKGDHLHLAWFDQRDGDVEVYLKRSEDGGDTWGTDLRLTTAAGVSQFPSIAVADGAVHVVWVDDRGGRQEVMYTRSR